MSDLSTDAVFQLSSRIRLLPVRHGSADVSRTIRDLWLRQRFDCVGLPLPVSVKRQVEEGVNLLPIISLVLMPEPDGEHGPQRSYIPIDPCQPVIAAIRMAMEEGIDRAYLDRETAVYEPTEYPAADPYALKHVSLASFAGASLPFLPYPKPRSQRWNRITWMAFKLHELELDYQSILCLCSIEDWPWLRDAYRRSWPYEPPERLTERPTLFLVEPNTLYFILCELPYLTDLFERRRAAARSDAHLSIDGIKELLLESRSRWLATRPVHVRQECNWVTPQLLQMYLRYVRNLALRERRLTPDLYTLALAAKQFAGDDFSITLLETAKDYTYRPDESLRTSLSFCSVGRGILKSSDGRVTKGKNRLSCTPVSWRTLFLNPRPEHRRRRQWAYRWNPFGQCSWPPEDNRIEAFTAHVREQSKALLGSDQAHVDKFTTSIRDGIDMRETLRRWNPSQGRKVTDVYVKNVPPARGNVEIVVFLFEVPANPAKFSWQATWYAEHAQESTLCFYATPFLENVLGPGIGQSQYGGMLFLFPPRPIPDIWKDARLDFAQTLERRLLAAAAFHSLERHVTLVSPVPPLADWKHIAGRFGRKFIPIPLSRFSGQTVARLRRFAVLNGRQIRSFAGQFIQG